MKSIKYILASAALLSAFCACKKEIAVEPADGTQTGEKQIITATVNVSTKVTYSENTPGGGSGISSVWAEGDKFYAIQDGNTVVTFNLVSGAGNTSATFEAETEGVTASTQWKAVLGGHASVHGAETSHGIKLNEHHYLGLGAGAMVFPNGRGYPTFAEAFMDYQFSFLKANSTPFLGVKAGYIRALGFGKEVNGHLNDYFFKNGASLQPELGWQWGIKPGFGLGVAAGANFVLPVGLNPGGKPLYVLPRISFTLFF